ncbi:hypothetical protein HW555_013929 [Spodoptera exigua]|uniref:Uncharacterized protein n=1 Tax=Spodoptera exigua TaxID=7107 RepID=A0A835G1W9_SPOEX|nr:hypothetical protein HW555_013929 [Spodoptera exigua]
MKRPQTHPQMNLYEPSTRRQVVQSMLVLVRCNTYARRMDIETVAAAAINLFCTYKYYLSVYRNRVIKKKWRRRRWWMLTIHRNRTKNSMENQFAELYAEPSGEFNNFVRMSSSDFEYLLQKISPTIAKKDTDWRDAIPVKVRLAVTLRYLATGDSYRSLHYLFKISSQVISIIVPEVCLALNNVLKDLVKFTKNFALTNSPPNSEDKYLNGELIQPGSWRQNYTGTFDPLQPIPRRAPACAVETRLKFTRYINENNH